MTPKMYFTTTGIVFMIVGFAHLLRLILSWDVRIGEIEIPLWISGVAVLLAGYLMYSAYRLNQRQ